MKMFEKGLKPQRKLKVQYAAHNDDAISHIKSTDILGWLADKGKEIQGIMAQIKERLNIGGAAKAAEPEVENEPGNDGMGIPIYT
jgi:hypothetical protein